MKIMQKKLIFILTLILTACIGFIAITYSQRIYPGVYIANFPVGNKTLNETEIVLSKNLSRVKEIVLGDKTEQYKIPLSSVGFFYNLQATIKDAYFLGRSGNISKDIKNIIQALSGKVRFKFKYSLNEEELNSYLSTIAGQVTTEPIYPSVKIVDGKVVVDRGKSGLDVNINKIKSDIEKNLINGRNPFVEIEKEKIDPSLTDIELQKYQDRASKLADKALVLNLDSLNREISSQDLVNLISPHNGEYLEKELISTVTKIADEVNKLPRNPVLVFDGEKVKEFSPEINGIEVNKDQFKINLIASLRQLEKSDEKQVTGAIPIEITPPKIKTEDINNLGIKSLIGKGTSKFVGSIPSRIYNITLASLRLNGVLIKPNETFSFNEVLGDVSKFTGYKEAYIIKDGKTILGDGGGVCQVSTTLFRAVLNAGLPIIERHAHAYRVYYYEEESPAGFDATVYAPTADLKIKNDTPGYILIQTKTDTKNLTLTFELYGTNDGRQVTISKPITSSVATPPDDLYQDDPTLPIGTVRQTEHKSWGAKVTFDYLVTREGEVTFQKTFISNYRPWQAVYLRGTAPLQ
ncbi:hypothetical protein A2627_00500 [Candidatus Woesebacteria bacterium RIFCSPHIGHO2_01_FULL_39_28]|uniref:YoaR-like putative peptidoglycan binding domain-containing protein n=1 Tax=Candidatus Woesebacteria bacterium RIFCSPHIGHO2_01_FULL_39_28 TaxID=1802496 RepID=A0A1F7YN34_9BACT|nr:MAG: hypothetical protein A2627_00500 [Candidatus Woesebacteria bacterium RIFCSPHIGHO2_01_FULL_39_28]OGM56708.1 MAG: hypothetical protein A3A50_05120 [Candidatus Woesebacteria bacterium RIFCSPLOWO2_01_FULL_38_20]